MASSSFKTTPASSPPSTIRFTFIAMPPRIAGHETLSDAPQSGKRRRDPHPTSTDTVAHANDRFRTMFEFHLWKILLTQFCDVRYHRSVRERVHFYLLQTGNSYVWLRHLLMSNNSEP